MIRNAASTRWCCEIALVRVLAGLLCLLCLRSRPASAQQDSAALGVQGTVADNLMWYKEALNATNSSGGLVFGSALGARFSGRVALAISRRALVGVAVGSWESGTEGRARYHPVEFVGDLGAPVTAVVASGYLQIYPVNSWLFARGGVGYAAMSTYPANLLGLTAVHNVRMTVSAGVGADLPFARHLALTPSVDLTIPFGSTAGELRSGVAAGLGLTVR